jgi:hypothetical protein
MEESRGHEPHTRRCHRFSKPRQSLTALLSRVSPLPVGTSPRITTIRPTESAGDEIPCIRSGVPRWGDIEEGGGIELHARRHTPLSKRVPLHSDITFQVGATERPAI